MDNMKYFIIGLIGIIEIVVLLAIYLELEYITNSLGL
jgi:hypothetical protein